MFLVCRREFILYYRGYIYCTEMYPFSGSPKCIITDVTRDKFPDEHEDAR